MTLARRVAQPDPGPDLLLTPGYCEALYSNCTLSQLLVPEVFPHPTHHWVQAEVGQWGSWHLAALWVANHIVRVRTGGAPRYFSIWRSRAEGVDRSHGADLLEVLAAQIADDGVGRPNSPASTTRLEGYVAEHIWHGLASEVGGALGVPRWIVEPSWDVLDHGADSVTIFQMNDGSYAFRLWEIKSHTGVAPVRDTVSGARRQLDKNATRYLARLSKIGETISDADLSRFYGEMSRLWVRSDRAAGAGIGVIADASCEIDNAFASLGEFWPEFVAGDQSEGLLGVLPDAPTFARHVRGHIWKGL